MLFLLLSIVITLPYTLLLLFFRSSWLKADAPPYKSVTQQPFISVIIPARNEEENISKCLQSISIQTYPDERYEIIVVDDHSTDQTASIVSSFLNENVKIIQLQDLELPANLNSFKKFGIDVAIRLARGELIVTTDADCEMPAQWLQTIAGFQAATNSTFIAAPVEMWMEEGNERLGARFLKIFQALDFMTLQGITGAVVKTGFANMCNGANLAYLKRAFYEVKGFEGVDHLASGDDMLLMEKIYELPDAKIRYLQEREAIVKTKPANSVKEFLQQRTRWASKSTAYKGNKLKAILLLVFLFNLWVAALFVASFFSVTAFFWLLTTVFFKVTAELSFLIPVARFFRRGKLLRWFLLAQPVHIMYTIFTGVLGNTKTYEWKGRRVK